MLKPSNHQRRARGRAPMEWVLLAGLIVVAAALRFWRIGSRAGWMRRRVGRLLGSGRGAPDAQRGSGNPPLYYLALGQWLALFGDSDRTS